ncbi:MAG: hypothetical protein U1F54_13915 [Burkholderiales bacterium]
MSSHRSVAPALAAAACLALFAMTSAPALAQSDSPYELPPQLPGKDLVPERLLKSPLHTVAEPVAMDGFLGRFEIDSSFGKFRVAGANMLAVRVHELAAIKALGDVDRSAAFQDALVRSAQVPGQFIANAFTDPNATVENVASGVGTVLGRIGRLATTSARAVGDAASDTMSSSAAAPQAVAQPTGEPLPPSFTGDPFGFNKARREWAKELGIDPYTTNPVLRQQLDSAARATFAGNFAINATIGLVAAPLQYAASFDTVVRDSVWNTPVIDLIAQNERKLQAMGISGRPVRDFFRNRWFTPSLQTALVVALEHLPGVRGRESVVAAATEVRGEARARSLIGAVLLVAQHHKNVAPVKKVRTSGVVVVGEKARGEIVVAADLDYLWWNADSAAFAARSDVKAKKRTLLVSGAASEKAAQELERARWDVRTRLRPEPAN